MSSMSEQESSSNNNNNHKVTADSYGNIKIDSVRDECWMLRIPPKLAEAWEKAPQGTVLGDLVFRKGGVGNRSSSSSSTSQATTTIKPTLEIHVDPSVSDPHSTTPLPLAYSLGAMTKKIPTLHPFSRRPNGSIHLHGTVTRTGNLQVIQDDNYRQLCKTRILQSTVHNSRYVKTVEANQVVQQSQKTQRTTTTSSSTAGGIGGGKGFGHAIHQYGKRMLEQANQIPDSTKRLKFDPDQPTRSIVFELFAQQPFWTVKDLKVATGGRAETEIRDVLREIGDYHRSGDHKNSWELRHEFQNTGASASSSSALSAPGATAALSADSAAEDDA